MRLPHDAHKVARNWGRVGVKQRLLYGGGAEKDDLANLDAEEEAELREATEYAAEFKAASREKSKIRHRGFGLRVRRLDQHR